MSTCDESGCDRPAKKRIWCNTHYEVRRRAGQLVVQEKDPVKRLFARIQTDPNTGCWIWTGAKSNGYGRIRFNGRLRPVHRVVYELLREPVPDDLDMDHLCRNPPCANPDHLEPVAHRTNLMRGESPSAENAKHTQCPSGHEFTEENTYLWNGARHCRTCRAETTRRIGQRRDRRTVVAIECVMCGTTFELVRAPGQTPNVCSPECRKARQRKTAREFQRQKRAAQKAA